MKLIKAIAFNAIKKYTIMGLLVAAVSFVPQMGAMTDHSKVKNPLAGTPGPFRKRTIWRHGIPQQPSHAVTTIATIEQAEQDPLAQKLNKLDTELESLKQERESLRQQPVLTKFFDKRAPSSDERNQLINIKQQAENALARIQGVKNSDAYILLKNKKKNLTTSLEIFFNNTTQLIDSILIQQDSLALPRRPLTNEEAEDLSARWAAERVLGAGAK